MCLQNGRQKTYYKYEYDCLGNPVNVEVNTASTNKANGPYAAITYEYDYAGRVTKETDSIGGVKEYTYDMLGRKIAEKDKNGNTTRVTSANGKNITNYVYDKYKRVTKMTDPMGYVETYTYDIAGNMLSKTDRNGNVLTETLDNSNINTYTYNKVNLVINKTVKKGSVLLSSYGNTYYLDGNLKSNDFFVYAKAHKITNYTYYVFNHLVSTTDETDNKSIYAYYPSNLRFSKQVTDGSNTTYTGFMWDGSQIVLKNQLLWETGFIAFSLFP